jgi:hypothetical protein
MKPAIITVEKRTVIAVVLNTLLSQSITYQPF